MISKKRVKDYLQKHEIKCKAFLTGIWMSTLPLLARADSGDALNTILTNIFGWLSGPLGISAVGVAVVHYGYQLLHGRAELKKVVCIVGGAGLIVGTSYIVHQILLKGLGG